MQSWGMKLNDVEDDVPILMFDRVTRWERD
jgi:hypothetical protein